MANPFAEIESATALAAVAACANATATVGGVSVEGIFDLPTDDAFGLMPDSQPVFLCVATAISSIVVGAIAVINSTAYTVAGINPDGTGMAVLRLKTRDISPFDNGFSLGFGT